MNLDINNDEPLEELDFKYDFKTIYSIHKTGTCNIF